MDKSISRRRFLRRAAFGVAGAALLGGESVRQAYAFQVNHHQRQLRGLRAPLRAAVLTDLHLGPFIREAHLERWVAASNDARPDVVFLVGDVVDQWYDGDLSEVSRWVAQLAAPLGTYVVPGNHDYGPFPDIAPLRRALTAAGATFLVNAGTWARDDVYVAGSDDVMKGSPDASAATAGAAAGEGATILLSHNPDLIPELSDGVDLVLSGHTHGGQVKIPFLGPIFTSSRYWRRYAEGWVDAGMPAFVSRGLGVSLLPLRFACPPELVVLDLQPA